MHWRRVEAKVLARRGESERAEGLAREAVSLIEATDMLDEQGDALVDLAVVLERAGERGEAAARLRDACDRYARKENLLALERARAKLATLSPA